MGAYAFCPRCGDPLATPWTGPDTGRPACPTGHFVFYDNPAVTVMGFVERDRRFLVLCRAIEPRKGEWDMPGFVEAASTRSRRYGARCARRRAWSSSRPGWTCASARRADAFHGLTY